MEGDIKVIGQPEIVTKLDEENFNFLLGQIQVKCNKDLIRQIYNSCRRALDL